MYINKSIKLYKSYLDSVFINNSLVRINNSNAFKIIKIKYKVCILDRVFINNSFNKIKCMNISVYVLNYLSIK